MEGSDIIGMSHDANVSIVVVNKVLMWRIRRPMRLGTWFSVSGSVGMALMAVSPALLASSVALLPLLISAGSGAFKEECDHLSLHFYGELGCQPQYSGYDRSCPTSFDCGKLEQNRRNFCVVKDIVVDKGGRIEYGTGIDNPCVPGCHCFQNYDQSVTKYRWQCTHSDCPQYFRPNPNAGCFWQEELKSCCPWRKVCKKTMSKCSYNGITYKENDRFYSFKGSKCFKCVCGPQFNGTLREPSCTEIGCDMEIHDGEQLARGCAPIYSKNFCCPIDWRCPDPEDAVIKGTKTGLISNTGAQCKFGGLLLDVGDSISPDYESTCYCRIPPYVICTST